MSEPTGYVVTDREGHLTYLLPEEKDRTDFFNMRVQELHAQPQEGFSAEPAVFRSWYWCHPGRCHQSTKDMVPHYLGSIVHEFTSLSN